MATPTQLLPSHMITFLILISLTTIHSTQQDHKFVKSLDPKTLQLNKEKLTHFRVYWHDVVSGSAPTSVAVVNPYKNSSTAFGMIRMIDNALTEEPDVKSKLVGRAQGFYSSTSQSDLILLMSMNFAFFVGKYNGSTITVLGRNDVFSKIREMPVIGGSGLFRYARGYAQARTHTVNLKTGDAVVEYNVYVLHY